ncbi:hypothetical protein [Dasania marina]|uniref:hypothetical protein n=1 Tax=Dasania marina TaxID=471499 RepID=UPI0030DC6961|tara:strand:+ start:16670 stop:17281 length:612 start_codon:yes stop_codon:yes gene_type:complete
MSWKPSSEAQLVLRQIGYPSTLIETAIAEYQSAISKRPGYCMSRDHDFVTFLRTRFFRQSVVIEAKHRKIGLWQPTTLQYKELEDLGYWKEVIDNQLSHFIFDGNQSTEIVISKYGLFKDYLQRRVPIANLDISNWRPSKSLTATIFTELIVYEEDFDLFFVDFLALAKKRGVESHLLPRFFFSFIKKNQVKIWNKGFARKQG